MEDKKNTVLRQSREISQPENTFQGPKKAKKKPITKVVDRNNDDQTNE